MPTEKEKILPPPSPVESDPSGDRDQMDTWREIRDRIGMSMDAPE